ncbi:hypothetical protein I5E68_19910 [Novosphingobium sp. YJ-S2-02]|uniref:Uncharacterized protein n=1 Tax=Novosphingobium aureum TaxID=2792964 RepID=A0A931MMJ4_9SPHN|nr:hypothetical protein [Novosphingobium aureum]MBH0115207.1 hypothetical protein [Novosphingobium aureum]
MEPCDPWSPEDTLDARDLARAQARSAHALGRLDGRLASLPALEERLFCADLVRRTLLGALTQAGYLDAPQRFDAWFAGLARGPERVPEAPSSPLAIVRALLAEMARHPWEPLALTAQTLQRCARFVGDAMTLSPEEQAREVYATSRALDRARALVEALPMDADGPLPFAALAALCTAATHDPAFAPMEAGVRTFDTGETWVALAGLRPITPLWALDVAVSAHLARRKSLARALPMPGLFTTERLLMAHAADRQRLQLALALNVVATAHLAALDTAHARAALLTQRLAGLRRNSRAGAAWILLAGFAPLGLDQLMDAIGVSRRGTYALSAALTEAGLAERQSGQGKVQLVATERAKAKETPGPVFSGALGTAVEEFDDAMADLDRLLARPGNQGATGR